MSARPQELRSRAAAAAPARSTLARTDADRRLFDSVGAFLFSHRLEPTPANYLLAYKLVTRTNAAAVAAIERATSDGVRLSQREADRIVKEARVQLDESERMCPSQVDAMEEARRQLDVIEAIVGITHADAERYGRDLERGAAELRAFSPSDPLEDLLRVTAKMIERTKEAEDQLQSTSHEVQSLRRELASMSEAAKTDPLTGLANRRGLEDRVAWLQKSGIVFSAAICDIDRFKAINDTHGHAVGDRVLEAVARIIEEASHGHLVARYGGEEFVVLLRGLRAPAAAKFIEVARHDLAGRQLKVRETGRDIGAVSFSAGVAEARPEEPWSDLIRRADAMLYRAKSLGRNRIEVEEATAISAGSV